VLAARIGLTSGAVTAMLDRLEQMRLITRSPNPSDRREIIVRATPEAAERSEALLAPLVSEGAQPFLSRYIVKEIELIVDFMQRARELQQRHVERVRSMDTHP
jgi:DNA-binding MarR family transcriptional regulator